VPNQENKMGDCFSCSRTRLQAGIDMAKSFFHVQIWSVSSNSRFQLFQCFIIGFRVDSFSSWLKHVWEVRKPCFVTKRQTRSIWRCCQDN